MANVLASLVTQQYEAMTRRWLTSTLERQLAAQGVTGKPELLGALVEHLLSHRRADTFTWEDDETGDQATRPALQLSLTDEDFREFRRMQQDAIEAMPGAVGAAIKGTARSLLNERRRRWPDVVVSLEAERATFLYGLDAWWHDPLEELRMLQVMAVEEAQAEARRIRRSRAKRNLAKRDVQFRLHVRICQVADEIIMLLEHGFPDGAMARWRTIHELVVVALVIYDNDDDLARRYLDHEAVEAWRAADLFQRVRVPAGDKPYSTRQMAEFVAERDAVIDRYGKSFGGHYGWAAQHLNHRAPTFEHLEEAAGRVALRSHYKLASYNVHAGPKGISFKHGAGDNPAANLAGASMYGLEVPGCNTAYALAQACALFVEPREGIEHLVRSRSLMMLRDSICRRFVRAGKAIRDADRALDGG